MNPNVIEKGSSSASDAAQRKTFTIREKLLDSPLTILKLSEFPALLCLEQLLSVSSDGQHRQWLLQLFKFFPSFTFNCGSNVCFVN